MTLIKKMHRNSPLQANYTKLTPAIAQLDIITAIITGILASPIKILRLFSSKMCYSLMFFAPIKAYGA